MEVEDIIADLDSIAIGRAFFPFFFIEVMNILITAGSCENVVDPDRPECPKYCPAHCSSIENGNIVHTQVIAIHQA